VQLWQSSDANLRLGLQVGANGKKAPLNVGFVLMLPEGFKVAPDDRVPEELKEKTGVLCVLVYGTVQCLVPPMPGWDYRMEDEGLTTCEPC
jgi:apocytochrome f